MSGRPGTYPGDRRYPRAPSAKRALRGATSGPVFRARFAFITAVAAGERGGGDLGTFWCRGASTCILRLEDMCASEDCPPVILQHPSVRRIARRRFDLDPV